jgi:hypothetical protein
VDDVRWLIAGQLEIDPELRGIRAPTVRLQPLPASHAAACRLLTDLARI